MDEQPTDPDNSALSGQQGDGGYSLEAFCREYGNLFTDDAEGHEQLAGEHDHYTMIFNMSKNHFIRANNMDPEEAAKEAEVKARLRLEKNMQCCLGDWQHDEFMEEIWLADEKEAAEKDRLAGIVEQNLVRRAAAQMSTSNPSGPPQDSQPHAQEKKKPSEPDAKPAARPTAKKSSSPLSLPTDSTQQDPPKYNHGQLVCFIGQDDYFHPQPVYVVGVAEGG